MTDRRVWASKVGKVFDTRPRVASKSTVWLERKSAYESLSNAIEQPGMHVCLDGPTGVGKTSLIHTYIANEQIRHCAIMITQATTWADMCRRLIGTPSNEENSTSGEFEVGLNNGLPTAKFKVYLGMKERPLDDLTYADKLATTWTEHDVAKRLAANDLVLVIDDLERANDQLMTRISDLCKLITQAYVSQNSKVVMIGSGDVYVRLHRANSALDERVSQVCLGAFKYPNDSRIFLQRGLERLFLRNPWNSAIPKEFDLRDKCRDAVWEAADGLPKSLNRLGYEIGIRGRDRSGITATDIFECAQSMVEEHWIQYSQEFPEVLEILESHPAAVQVLKCMYEDGITRIHKVSRIISQACMQDREQPPFPKSDVDSGIDLLVGTGFIVRTGKSSELLFVKHPAAAHTLGVVMRDPAKVQHLPALKHTKKNHAQLGFAFPLPTDYKGYYEGDAPSDDA
jgi:hypothetical protein